MNTTASTAESPSPKTTETILLAVTGMSPAILTETIWALAHPGAPADEPVIPDRIVAVTTAEGRHRLEAIFTPTPQLENRSPWDALRRALAAEGHDLRGKLRFGTTSADIRVITATDPDTARSHELPDIRNRAENEAAADFILEQVRGIVENPDTRLIASIAGGRKTMSALLYACMTLIGREGDHLTHVLVSEPFESVSGFWFPGQPGGPLTDPSGNPADPRQALVQLAHVPFVPLRNLFHRELGQPAGSFRRLVETCQVNVRETVAERILLEIETTRPESRINGTPIRLSAREHLVLLYFAERVRAEEPVLSAYDEAINGLDAFRKAIQAQAPDNDWSDWRTSEALANPIDERQLTRCLSEIRSKTKKAGGDAPYLATLLPRKGRCALDLPADHIRILRKPRE
ncbi:MAG: TIGR02584 family CRISPR-associated protein [Verrucomicrobia bacterium]|nr:MAG: TIGR02584 family CRISPR-associated protein [Verrucomicrobiota bacterium]